jgi:hypothetical protein
MLVSEMAPLGISEIGRKHPSYLVTGPPQSTCVMAASRRQPEPNSEGEAERLKTATHARAAHASEGME